MESIEKEIDKIFNYADFKSLDKMININKSIYPNVSVKFVYNSNVETDGIYSLMILETHLRKCYRKKYYLQKFYREIYIKDFAGRDEVLANELNHFHSEVYKGIVLGKVDLKLILHTPVGREYSVFTLDEDQRSEKERLT